MASSRSESYFFIGILLIVAVLVGFVFLPELDAIVLGISIAILFYPWYVGLKKTLHDRSAAAAALIVVLAIRDHPHPFGIFWLADGGGGPRVVCADLFWWRRAGGGVVADGARPVVAGA